MKRAILITAAVLTLAVAGPATTAQEVVHIKVDPEHVRTWNRFAERVYRLHQHLLKTNPIHTTERSGGYYRMPDFYREIRYYDARSGRLLSRIEWETARPDTIHVIEVFVYDGNGRVTRDYLAAFLPDARNAPVQTLVNLHQHSDGLHAFRQFDASGERIYERCTGRHSGKEVAISLEDYELGGRIQPEVMASEAYVACFGELPLTAAEHLDPLSALPDTPSAADGLPLIMPNSAAAPTD